MFLFSLEAIILDFWIHLYTTIKQTIKFQAFQFVFLYSLETHVSKESYNGVRSRKIASKHVKKYKPWRVSSLMSGAPEMNETYQMNIKFHPPSTYESPG